MGGPVAVAMRGDEGRARRHRLTGEDVDPCVGGAVVAHGHLVDGLRDGQVRHRIEIVRELRAKASGGRDLARREAGEVGVGTLDEGEPVHQPLLVDGASLPLRQRIPGPQLVDQRVVALVVQPALGAVSQHLAGSEPLPQQVDHRQGSSHPS